MKKATLKTIVFLMIGFSLSATTSNISKKKELQQNEVTIQQLNKEIKKLELSIEDYENYQDEDLKTITKLEKELKNKEKDIIVEEQVAAPQHNEPVYPDTSKESYVYEEGLQAERDRNGGFTDYELNTIKERAETSLDYIETMERNQEESAKAGKEGMDAIINWQDNIDKGE